MVSITTPCQERLKRIAIAAGKDVDVVQVGYIEAVDERNNGMDDEHAIAAGDDSAEENHEYLTDEVYQQEEENELRRTVQAVFELEEALLNQHMSNIQVEYRCCITYAFFSITCALTGYSRRTQKCLHRKESYSKLFKLPAYQKTIWIGELK